MNDFLNYVNELLNNLVTDFTGQTGSFIVPAKIIAGIGALIAIYMVFKKSVTEGEKINMNEVYRVGALALGIIFYGTFISFINAPLNLISESIKTVSVNQTNATDSFFESYQFGEQSQNNTTSNEAHDTEISDLINESENDLGVSSTEVGEEYSIGETISSLFSPMNIYANIQTYIAEAIFNVIHFLGVIAIIVLNVIRSFFLIVLTYFGIFVFAISIYPGLQNSFFQWLQKYINVYLWLPISYILQGMISKMFTYFNAVNPLTTDGQLANFNNGLIGLVGLCSIIGFATVPTMSSWLINAATSGAGSKLKQKATSAAQQGTSMAKKAAAAKATGGVSVAAGGVGKK